MCGILGTNLSISDAQFTDALEQIAHRGPDDCGQFSEVLTQTSPEVRIRLGHQRLSILDLSPQGHQPMAILDDQVWIVFNGEIYNHLEIREQLDPTIQYRSSSDTETILQAYLAYGANVVDHLNGIFAFAIYDKRNGQLLVVRDQFGIKPLYYYAEPGKIAFASELKSLAGFAGIDPETDFEALVNYCQFLWSPGGKTPCKHIKKLKPGHLFTLDLKSPQATPQFTKYYEIPFDGRVRTDPESELIEQLDQLLTTAVQRQLLSDVPVGFFLSGGLDSSLIVALAKKIAGTDFNCYTIDLSRDAEFDGFADDLSYAQRVAEYLGVNLIQVPGTPDILRDFDRMIWHLDEPQSDPAPLHVWNISRAARENGDVVLLGGTAGDDLFSGYRRHQALNLERWFKLTPPGVGPLTRWLARGMPSGHPLGRRFKKLAKGLGETQLARMAGYYAWLELDRIKSLFIPEIADQIRDYQPTDHLIDALAAIPEEHEPLNQMLFWDLKFFLTDHNLNYTDKMSMAAGVEVRVPFLDRDLVAFACQLPVSLKMKGQTTKYLLKKVAERYLPNEIIYRPKTGFGAPVRKWVGGGLLDQKIKALQERSRIFSPEAIEKLVEDCKRGQLDGFYTIWSTLAIDSWMSQFARTTCHE